MKPLNSMAQMITALAVMLVPFSSSAQSSRSGVGAIPYDGGTTFRVWAPNASYVGLKGLFSSWGTIDLGADGNGYWSGDVDGAYHGQDYKYVITYNGWTFDRSDARARQVYHSTGNSVIYDDSRFDWEGDDFDLPWHNDLVMYEMHIGTYKARPNGWTPGHFSDAISRLDHLQDMGINAVQLMPVAEFARAHSMGYNPGVPYAIETDYGGPDGLKEFVRECHQRGIAVLMDVVHNHYGPTDNLLYQYDGWNQDGHGGIYFYQDDRRITPYGETRPDYGRAEVQDFIRDNTRMWIEDYHLDGFRWDSVYNIITTPWGVNETGRWLMYDINQMIHNDYPNTITIAEDNSSGLDFDAEWDAGDTDEFGARLWWVLTRGSDAERDMDVVSWEINDGSGHGRVIYTESHDMVNEENGEERLCRAIDGSDPNSIWARKRILLGAAATMTSVGIPMIFQGQEINEDWSFRPQNALQWDLLNDSRNQGILNAYTDLITLRRNLLGDTQGLKGTGANVYHIDNANKVIAYHRWDGGGIGDDTVVILNFAVDAWTNDNYSINFPYAGDWYLVFNSDDTHYGPDFSGIGHTQLTASGTTPSAAVNMGMYSALVYARSKHDPPTPAETVITPANPTGCEDITIEYTPNDGALSSAPEVYIHIGKNGWHDVIDPAPAMTWNGAAWVYTYPSIADTFTIDFAFHDGSNTWDNNDGLDWHIEMDDCQDAFGLVTHTPDEPSGCEAVTIQYDPANGPLKNVEQVIMHVGYNDWSFTVDPSPVMTSNAGLWEYTVAPPAGIYEMVFSFHDDDPDPAQWTWDNNLGDNWSIVFASCTEQIDISIASPARSSTGTNATVDVLGSSSQTNGVAFTILNLLSSESQSTGPSNDWSITAMPLELGTNIIMAAIEASGVSSNDGDRAENAAYTNEWATGQNDGTGWNPWILYGSSASGHFIANDIDHTTLNSMSNAWGLWSYDDLADALRPLQHFLAVGSTISFQMENGTIDPGKSVGIGLKNVTGDTLMELYFNGGDSHYTLRDGNGYLDTGIGWTDDGFPVSIRLDAPRQYTITIDDSHQWTRSLLGAGDQRVRFFRAWNYSAGSGESCNFYINNLEIQGGQWADYDAVEVIRTPTSAELDLDDDGMRDTWEQTIIDADPEDGITTIDHVLPDADFDGDGMNNQQEYIAGTSPVSTADCFVIDTVQFSNTQWQLTFPSRLSRKYKIYYTDDDLAANRWSDASPHQDIWGNNQILEWSQAPATNTPTRFYRVIAEFIE